MMPGEMLTRDMIEGTMDTKMPQGRMSRTSEEYNMVMHLIEQKGRHHCNYGPALAENTILLRFKEALYRILCGANRLGDSGASRCAYTRQ